MTDSNLFGEVATRVGKIAADLKNVIRDVEGLMYGRDRNGALCLREYVAIADTNTRPPEDCDSYAWAVRGQLLELQEYLEGLQGARLAMVCPCCAAVDLMEDVLNGTAGWKLVADTHSENLVGDHIVPVNEWQCGVCAPYAHGELKEGLPKG